MKFSDLSAADQQLLRTDLGDFDKVAAQQLEEASDCYNQGFEKFAADAADAQDEADEMDKQASEYEDESGLTPEQEKVAAQLGAITEKGFFDGLCKLGSERHGDEMHYLWPYIEQKIAQEGAAVALEKAIEQLSKVAEEGGRSALGTAGLVGGGLAAGGAAGYATRDLAKGTRSVLKAGVKKQFPNSFKYIAKALKK